MSNYCNVQDLDLNNTSKVKFSFCKKAIETQIMLDEKEVKLSSIMAD